MPKVDVRPDTTPDPDGWHFNMDGGPAEAERARAHAIDLWDREYVRWARVVRARDADLTRSITSASPAAAPEPR